MDTNRPWTVAELRQLQTIRKQCEVLYRLGQRNELHHFVLHEDRIEDVVDYVQAIVREDYPTREIPFHSRWRHFEAGGTARQKQLEETWDADAVERIRRHIDLVVVSVLLDAGAGPTWRYLDTKSGEVYGRSEGLGVASLNMFSDGLFSSDPDQPHRVDARALGALSVDALRVGFQVSDTNSMTGLEGRLALLHSLSSAMKSKPHFFGGSENPRPGHLIDWLMPSDGTKTISVAKLWQGVIEGFEDVWPRAGRILQDGKSLGDAWWYTPRQTAHLAPLIVPFHKLSQWLTYSLLEPISAGGFVCDDISSLTGLPEYRNGGLFVDFGVLTLKDPAAADVAHEVGSYLIVEWRALTLVLLDKTAQGLRHKLQLGESEFPLARVLEAGTWKAGRRIAAQKRPGGTPPIQVISDGTVF